MVGEERGGIEEQRQQVPMRGSTLMNPSGYMTRSRFLRLVSDTAAVRQIRRKTLHSHRSAFGLMAAADLKCGERFCGGTSNRGAANRPKLRPRHVTAVR